MRSRGEREAVRCRSGRDDGIGPGPILRQAPVIPGQVAEVGDPLGGNEQPRMNATDDPTDDCKEQ